MPRKPITRATLTHIAAEMPVVAGFEAEVEELVAPRLGIITGFQDLLDAIAAIEAVDLGAVPPAGPIKPSGRRR